jgi:acrylyl-CoA reductase (NADPH)
VDRFRAFVVEHREEGSVREVRELSERDLPPGEVTIRVGWSCVNFKDALAADPEGRVAKVSPLVPGIDLAGEVVASDDRALPAGTAVLVHGYDLGVARHGGFAQLARVPAGWVVPLPAGLDARAAMALGTAGYTAALSVHRLEERGLRPGAGPVLVLGATGGVGSVATSILAARGYEVHASTGKPGEGEFLRALGAAEVLAREETSVSPGRPLEPERWAGVVDPVGGASLAYALRTLQTGAAVASSGNTGGVELHTTVLPFILRGVALLGVDSVRTPLAQRREVWRRVARDLRPPALDDLVTREVGLDALEEVLLEARSATGRGRTLVRVG